MLRGPWWTTCVVLGACGHGVSTYDTFGGGTVSVALSPAGDRGVALAWEGAGATGDELSGADACTNHVVVVRDGDVTRNSVIVCTPVVEVPDELCFSTARFELQAEQYEDTGASADASLTADDPEVLEVGFASLPDLGSYTTSGQPDDLAGRVEGDLDVDDLCGGDPVPHHFVVEWAFDASVKTHTESEDGGGLPGVGD